MTYPKPSKKDRVLEDKRVKSELVAYRSKQAAIAINRDNSLCVICYFRDNITKARADVHHVYGRGKEAGDWREDYENLMCVCRACHPLPIQTPGGDHSLSWVEDILETANATPINPRFYHPGR